MLAVAYRNTERTARPKFEADNDVVVKTYYPREKIQGPQPTWRERAEKAWAMKQERERQRIEAIDRAIREAKAVEAYRTIEVLPPPADKVSVRDIIHSVAVKHGFTAELILGERRSKPLVIARHEAICEAARLRPDMSLPELGRQFKRDHTTIIHALRKAGVDRKHLDRET